MGVLPDLSYIVLYCAPHMRFRQPAPVRIGRWPRRLDAVDFDRSPHAGVVLVGDHASRIYLSWGRAANFLCRNASDFAIQL